MASMMLMLHTMQSTNQAILNCLDAMDNTSKKNHGRLHAAINSKADSSKIARLDHRLEDMAHTIRDDVNNTIGTQLTSATNSIIDLKANLLHLTKTHTTRLDRLDDMLISQHAFLDSYATSYDDRFAALEQRLSSPTNPPSTTVVDPSLRGCNGSPSQFPSTVFPEGRVDDAPGPDGVPRIPPATRITDIADDVVDFMGTVPPPRAPPRTVHNNSPQVTAHRSIDPTGVLPDDSTFTLPSGHFGSGLGGPTVNIAPPRRGEQGANAHAAHMAGPAGAHFRAASSHTPSRPVTRPPHITPPPSTPPAYVADPTVIRPPLPCTGGIILTPREHQECTKGVNRFNIEGLAHPPYHGKTHGVDPLTVGFLANCGFNTVSSDDVVSSLNDIVTIHCRISDTWTNPSANTSRPQVDLCKPNF